MKVCAGALRSWIGIRAQASVPKQTAKLWTAATIAPEERERDPVQNLPHLGPRKLRPSDMAEVLKKLAESCWRRAIAFRQYWRRWSRLVRFVRGWSASIAQARVHKEKLHGALEFSATC